MSHENNTQYLESMKEDFYIALEDRKYEVCAALIEKLKADGFVDEGFQFQGELDEEIEIRQAEDKGSEDGVDLLQDKE